MIFLMKPYLKEVTTDDGTVTLYNEKFKEACHSTSGATQETITHYFNGCQVADKLKKYNKVNILEVGFGTGNGFVTTLRQIKACKLSELQVNFTSLELDIENIIWAANHYPELNELSIEQNPINLKIDNISLKIYLGDARETIKQLNEKFDCIYQDAFSPKKNPTLWTTEWFIDLKNLSKADTILSTYSASSAIQKSLVNAGWSIYPGEKFGPKRASTRATLNRESDINMIDKLNRSPVEAFTDQNILKLGISDD